MLGGLGLDMQEGLVLDMQGKRALFILGGPRLDMQGRLALDMQEKRALVMLVGPRLDMQRTFIYFLTSVQVLPEEQEEFERLARNPACGKQPPAKEIKKKVRGNRP
jgi:hypothetical protein